MNHRISLLAVSAVATLSAAASLPSPAHAIAGDNDAKSTAVAVSIGGNDSPEGVVASPRRVCKAHVTVRVYRQVGTRGGGDDVRVGSPDTTDLSGGKWTWSIGNPGLNDGDRVYAKVAAHDGCRVAFSKTMTVVKM